MGLPRINDNRLNILAYVALPLFLGLAITRLNLLYVVLSAAILIYLCLHPRLQFYLFFISIFFPFRLAVGPINEMPISLIVAPLFLISMFSFMIFNGYSIRPGKHGRLFILALSLLVVCVIVGYARNSFSFFSIDMGDHESKMTALAYLNTFAGIMIFFSCFWFFSRISDDENRILKFFIFLAFSLMFVKMSGLLPQIFSTSFTQEYTTPQGATRLGGFDACVGLGIPALIAYSYDRVNIPRTLFIIALIALGIIGGGRSLMFGVLLTIIIYLILFYKRYSTKFLLACGIVVLATALAAQFVPLPKQIKRISGVTLIESGGFARQDPGRHILFSLYWDIFLENPVFGKGIGVYKEKMSGPLEFIKGELRDGGHGAYLSTLCIFGIVGGIFLGLMLFGGIYRSYKSILANNLQKNAVVYKKLTIFIMLYLLTLASEFTFGGDGYQKPEMYAVIGMLLGITRKEEEVVPATQP